MSSYPARGFVRVIFYLLFYITLDRIGFGGINIAVSVPLTGDDVIPRPMPLHQSRDTHTLRHLSLEGVDQKIIAISVSSNLAFCKCCYGFLMDKIGLNPNKIMKKEANRTRPETPVTHMRGSQSTCRSAGASPSLRRQSGKKHFILRFAQ